MLSFNHSLQLSRLRTARYSASLLGVVLLSVFLSGFVSVECKASTSEEKIEGLHFRGSVCDINLEPVKAIGGLTIDGKDVPYTLRIPSTFHTAGRHDVKLLGVASDNNEPLLLHTTLELISAEKNAEGKVVFRVNGFGHGVLRFANRKDTTPRILDVDGQTVDFEQWSDDTGTYLQVRARGKVLDLIWH